MQTFQYLDETSNNWPIIAYSKSLNIVISGIYKNATSTIEQWTTKNLDFRIIPYESKHEILEASTSTVFISILRDPIERAISAIHMNQWNYKRLCLDVDYKSFSKIEIGYEPHMMPQAAFIPTSYRPIDNQIDFSNMWDSQLPTKFPKNWTEVLESFDIIGRLKDNNKFFFMYEGKDIMSDINNYLNIKLSQSWLGNNPSTNYGDIKPELSEEYKTYLYKVYQYDYRLINSVKFINEGQSV